jgi:eukaryotic-like serine/threonine-protein kinase
MPAVSSERWRALSAHLEHALDLEEAARAAWLAAMEPSDPEMAALVRGLLAARDRDGFSSFLEGPPPIPADIGAAATLIGRHVGPYVIDAEIGRGGMGSVWRARRADGRYEGTVAIKFVHTMWLGHAGEQRFRVEGNLLGQLDHLNIARLLDAGVLDARQPYLVLEYVEGETIDAYCDRHSLPLDARIGLFLNVLAAVAHAHSHLIVHRDIKPANVFVTRDGTVKLLDFGIAKLLNDGTGSAELTKSSATALTPQYAAPEQLLGQPITTATDVYSLGLVLYVLLTGTHPIAIDSVSTTELIRAVLTEDPPPPSAVSIVPTIRRRSLQGDLDNVIGKALKKSPTERYPTAEAFAADLRGYLNHEPVSARRDSFAYRLGKLLRKNRLPVAAASITLLALLAGVVGIALQASEARRQRVEAVAQRERAQHEAARATAVKNFLVSIFRASDPRIASDKPRGQITAKDLLDASAERIGRQFANDPDTELQLLRIASGIYDSLGEGSRATALRQQRVNLARSLHGEIDADVIDGALEEVYDKIELEQYAEANRMLERPDRLLHKAGLDHSALRARWWLLTGESLWNRSDARQLRTDAFRRASAMYAEVAPRDPDYPATLNNLAVDANAAGDFANAKNYYERAMQVAAHTDERDDMNIGDMKVNFAITLQHLGEFAAAERAYEEAVQISLQTSGDKSPLYWDAVANEASMLHQRGDRERADHMFTELMPHIPKNWRSSSDDAFANEYFGACLAAEGRPEEGIPLLQRAEQTFRERPMDEYDIPRVLRRLGDAYDRAGRSDEARRALKTAYDERLSKSAPESAPVLDIRERWGRFLLEHGDPAAAETEFRTVIAQSLGRDLAPIALAHGGLAKRYLAAREASRALTEIHDALTTLDRVKGLYDVRSYPYLWRIHAQALLLSGDFKAAQAEARRALDASIIYDAPASAAIAEARVLLNHSAINTGGGAR